MLPDLVPSSSWEPAPSRVGTLWEPDARAGGNPSGTSIFIVDAMSNHPEAPTVERPASFPTPPLPDRARRTQSLDEALFDATYDLRRKAVHRKAEHIVDAAAEIDAAVWEAIHHGEHDLDRLWDVARAAAVRQRRWADRQRRNDRLAPDRTQIAAHEVDKFAHVEMRVDLVRANRQLRTAASTTALEWAARKVGLGPTDRMSSAVCHAGHRWAARIREQLEGSDAVA